MNAAAQPSIIGTILHELGDFELESGETLPEVRIAYRSWGRLSATADNVVVVCHALTGSPDVDLWWPGLLGAGRSLDPDRDFIVCCNVLGSCYGSTGPASPAPAWTRQLGRRLSGRDRSRHRPVAAPTPRPARGPQHPAGRGRLTGRNADPGVGDPGPTGRNGRCDRGAGPPLGVEHRPFRSPADRHRRRLTVVRRPLRSVSSRPPPVWRPHGRWPCAPTGHRGASTNGSTGGPPAPANSRSPRGSVTTVLDSSIASMPPVMSDSPAPWTATTWVAAAAVISRSSGSLGDPRPRGGHRQRWSLPARRSSSRSPSSHRWANSPGSTHRMGTTRSSSRPPIWTSSFWHSGTGPPASGGVGWRADHASPQIRRELGGGCRIAFPRS